MLNHKGSHSEYFQELCALAAGGQISEPEFVELQDHLQDCAHCRSTYADFTELLHDKLPLADPELMGSSRLASIFSRILPAASDFSHELAKKALRFHKALGAAL